MSVIVIGETFTYFLILGGLIAAKDLWHILVKWGEKISPKEGKILSDQN